MPAVTTVSPRLTWFVGGDAVHLERPVELAVDRADAATRLEQPDDVHARVGDQQHAAVVRPNFDNLADERAPAADDRIVDLDARVRAPVEADHVLLVGDPPADDFGGG